MGPVEVPAACHERDTSLAARDLWRRVVAWFTFVVSGCCCARLFACRPRLSMRIGKSIHVCIAYSFPFRSSFLNVFCLDLHCLSVSLGCRGLASRTCVCVCVCVFL